MKKYHLDEVDHQILDMLIENANAVHASALELNDVDVRRRSVVAPKFNDESPRGVRSTSKSVSVTSDEADVEYM